MDRFDPTSRNRIAAELDERNHDQDRRPGQRVSAIEMTLRAGYERGASTFLWTKRDNQCYVLFLYSGLFGFVACPPFTL